MTKRRKPLYVRKTESSKYWLNLILMIWDSNSYYAEQKQMGKFIIPRSFLRMKSGAVCHEGEWKA